MIWQTHGRIVSRGAVGGLFIPFGSGLPVGIYEVKEIMDTLTVTPLGKPAMRPERFMGLDLMGLSAEIAEAAMTSEEWKEACSHGR